MRIFVCLFFAAAILGPYSIQGQGSAIAGGQCLPVDSLAIDLKDEIAGLMTRRDSMAIEILDIYRLKRVQSPAIEIIRDPKRCAVAAKAYGRVLKRAVSGVHVLRVGRRYLVIDPAYQTGEWKTIVTFNSTFAKAITSTAY
jgi:hypothetical protein